MRLSHKIFALTFVIAAATLTAVAVHTVDQTTLMLTNHSINAADRLAAREAAILTEHVATAKSDALLLANIAAARRLSQSGGRLQARGHRTELDRVFRTLMQEKPYYTQVRLIGLAGDGRELVRVNQDATGIHSVPSPQLQSKGDRYYVTETASLSKNQAFISRLDLNREHGRIVEPHQPVLRVSTPVFSAEDHRVGALVINIDVNLLLKDIVALSLGGVPVLTDRSGQYLYHPDPSRTFAFEFGRRDTIQDEYGVAEEWQTWISGVDNPSAVSFATPAHIISVARLDLPGAWDESNGVRTFVIGKVLPQTLIRQSGDRLRDHLKITLFAVCAFLGIAIGGATAFLTRPVSRLTEAANRIAAGNSGVDIPATTRDEIGSLARAIKRMLAALEEAARTKELASVGRMAAMVAHDLRNALSSVKVNMHNLETSCCHPDQPVGEQWSLANEQIAYMEAVLSDMLTFARPEEMRFGWHDMTSVLDAAIIAVAPKAAINGVALTPSQLPPLPAVWGDRTQLVRLFRNLVENAVHAAGRDGSVRIQAQVVATDTGNRVAVEIIDDGDGIAEEDRARIFDPFFTTRATGTGLGLAIVKRITEQHGGRIDVYSKLGQGSTFRVVLPIDPAQGQATHPPGLAADAAE